MQTNQQETIQKLLSLFEILRDGVIVVNKEGRFIYANDSAAKNLGYEKDEFLQLQMSEIEAKESKKEFEQRFSNLASGDVLNYQTLHRAKDGTLKTIDVSFHMLTVNGDKVAYGIWHDVTPDKKPKESVLNRDEIITPYNEKIRTLDEENQKLRNSIDFIKKEFNELGAAKQKLEGFINDRNLDFKELNLRLDKEVNRRKELESEIKMIKGMPPVKTDETLLNDLKGKVVALESLLEKANKRIEQEQQRSEELYSNLLQVKDKMEAFKAQTVSVDSAIQKADQLSQELAKAKEKIGILESGLADAKKIEVQLIEAKDKAHEPYAEKAAAFEEINKKLKERIYNLEKEMSTIESHSLKAKSSAEESARQLEVSKAALQREIEKSGSMSLELDDLKRKINTINDENLSVTSGLEQELRSIKSSTDAALKDLNEKIFFKDSRLSEVEEQLAIVKREKERALQELGALRDDLDKKMKDKDSKIELVNKRLAQEYERHEKIEADSFLVRQRLEEKLKQESQKLFEAVEQLSIERAQVENLKTELETQKNQIEAPLRERLLILEETKEKLENEMQQFLKAEADLLRSRETLENFVKERISELEKMNKKLDTELAERKRTIAELLKTREQFKAPIRERISELEELTERLEHELADRRAAERELMKSNEHMEAFIKERIGNYMSLKDQSATGDKIQADPDEIADKQDSLESSPGSVNEENAGQDAEDTLEIPGRKDSGLMKFVNIIKGK